MRKILAIITIVIFASFGFGQNHALNLIQEPHYGAIPTYNTTELDSATQSTTLTYDYLLVDTTNQFRGGTLQSYFSGYPIRFNWRPDSVTGMVTDSLTITYSIITNYDFRTDGGTFLIPDYDEGGNALAVTIWDNYDWTDEADYTIDIRLDAPILGLRFYITNVQKGITTGKSHNLYHWIIKQ